MEPESNQNEQRLAVELDVAQRLQHVATLLINTHGVEALYEQILATAMAILHSDFAVIQMFYPDLGSNGALRLLGHRGLGAEAVKRWEWIRPTMRTTCAIALSKGRRIAVPDVRNCDFMAGSEELEGYLAAGILAAQSTPLVSRSGQFLGMVSTHWRLPHELSATELCSLDILARLAADCIERSRAEETLREKQQQLVSIYDAVRDVIFHLAVEPGERFRFLSVNAAFLRVTGLNPERVVGKTVDLVIPEPSLTMVLGKYRQAIRERTTVFWEETSDYPNGRLTGEVAIAPIFDNSGTCTHLVGSVHDITERKQAEARLRESEERLKLAQDAARLGVWDSDLRTDVITIWGKYADLHGLRPDRTVIPREEWMSLIHPEDRERVAVLRREAREGSHTFDAEFRVIWPDGSTHWVHGKGTVLTDDAGQPLRSMGVIWDITERKGAETALRDVQLTYKEVFDNFSECIFVLDVTPEGRFKIAGLNPAEQKAIGLSNVDVEGKFIEEVFPEDFAKGVIAHYRRCVDAGTLINYDEELNLPGGNRYFHTNLIPLRNSAGRIHRIVGCCMDFTDLKRSQEAALARQKLESVGTLASGIAHDFNNLLGGVLAQAEAALAERDSGSYPEEELSAIRTGAIRGSEIVRQLMVYAGEASGVPGLVDLSEIVREILALLKLSVSKHAVLKTDLEEPLPPVRANAAQISQILMNLVANASEAIGDQGGTIQVTTRRGIRGGPPGIERLAEGKYVQLEVSDTGHGMLPEDRARVFDPFFSTKAVGRGLGLAVVQGIVRSLGGLINLASEPGAGATFQIWLPVAETASLTPAYRASDNVREPAPIPSPISILIVEDEDLLRKGVAKMLGKRGFSVTEARDGLAALQAIRGQENPMNVLFLDVTLPGASGQEIMQEARRLRPGVRVVVTSAYSKEVAAASLQSAIQHFIRKPYRLDDLVRLIGSAKS